MAQAKYVYRTAIYCKIQTVPLIPPSYKKENVSLHKLLQSNFQIQLTYKF